MAGLVAAIAVHGQACASTAVVQQTDGEPKLVVLVSVDQLRGDLLDRYADVWTGGFRRLMREGMHYTRATHDHAMTATAPGHATLTTGVYPTRHGIVGNEWVEIHDGSRESVYAVRDLDAPILGDTLLEGRSPANFERDGLPDWIVNQDGASRVVSLSGKDRAAIGLAARAAGEVYWLHRSLGRFVTSSFYHDEYPEWISRFNDEVMPSIYADTIWENRVDPRWRTLARPDSSLHEADGVHMVFPHLARAEAAPPDTAVFNTWRLDRTPLPDGAVLAAAEAAMRDLELGQRGAVDFLAVSLSQTDRIGHAYGPFSQEQLDNLTRLDIHLGAFLDALDREVGVGNWVLGFSADHGVSTTPEHLDPPVARVGPARQREITAPLGAILNSGDESNLPERLAEALEQAVEVADVLTFDEIESGAPPDSFAVLFSRSHSRERLTGFLARFGLQIRWRPNLLLGAGGPGGGTTHGSPYYYDRWVPVIFLGAGVSAGRSDGPASTADIAPTLAELAGIRTPRDLDGRSLIRR